MKLAMVEIDEGSLMVTMIGTMTGALVTMIFCYLAFRVSLESRLKDLEHQVAILQDLGEAFLALEDRIRYLEIEASRLEALPRDGMTCPVARDRSIEDERLLTRND